jgi:hypothetical protein
VKRNYHTIDKQGKVNARQLGEFLSKNGQHLLPMVDLIEQCRMACDELIDVAGRATIQAVLELSAQQAAGGPRQQGKQREGEVVWYGRRLCCNFENGDGIRREMNSAWRFQAGRSNRLSINWFCLQTSLPLTHLACPFRIMWIASYPAMVRRAA